jgi:hypothetical protein
LDKKQLLVKVPVKISRDQLISGAWNQNEQLMLNPINSRYMDKILREYCTNMMVELEMPNPNEGSDTAADTELNDKRKKYSDAIESQESAKLLQFMATLNYFGLDKNIHRQFIEEIGQ